MTNAVIIDDNLTNIEMLKGLILHFCPTVLVIATATNIDEGYLIIHQHQPDIVFLDIEMYRGTGFDLLRKFKDVFFETIFVTAYDQYALRALREQAIDYLLKPVEITALMESVTKAEKKIALKKNNLNAPGIAKPGKLSLPVQDGYLFVDYHLIVRCEASGSYSNFYFNDGRKMTVSMRLKECEDLLPGHTFLRVHNSHIINLNYISKYVRGRGGYLVMSDNSTVDVSASRRDIFLDLIRRHK